MSVTTEMIKNLRDRTGAGMMDCKKALTEVKGDVEQAIEFLRKKGLAIASKKAARSTGDGAIQSYIHAGGKIGVLLEVNCETDFVARTDDFQDLVRDIAMHVAAAGPLYVKREDVPQDLVDKERAVFVDQAKDLGKPENVIEKIVDGKIDKFFADICLVEQAFVKDPDKTIKDLLTEKIAKLGENISIKRFVRYQLGE
ncbi:MAG: translation elongation factor Ts [Bdellovibrionales bacterium]|nr:translation elongation factor Ts [Bdellovibrionales bacterium]